MVSLLWACVLGYASTTTVGSMPRHFSSFALNEFKILLSNLTASMLEGHYLTLDLTMDANHTLETFFHLVQAHSEAQSYYPELQMDQEVGSVFSNSCRIQIVWNASNALFNITKPSPQNKSSKGKHDKKGGKSASSKKDNSKSSGNGGKVECGYCGGDHWQANCFKDPNGPNYRPGKPAKGTSNTKFNSRNGNGNPKRRGGEMMAFK